MVSGGEFVLLLCDAEHFVKLSDSLSGQVAMLLLSSGMVWVSTSRRYQKRELLLLHQIINWSLTGNLSIYGQFFAIVTFDFPNEKH